MRDRTTYNLFGLLVGGLAAIIGSAIFSIVFLIYFTWNDFELKPFLIAVIVAPLYVSQFSIVPGVLGGLFLSEWIIRADRSTGAITRMGLITGAIGGLVTSAIVLKTSRILDNDLPNIYFAILAIIIASFMGTISTHWLNMEKSRNNKESLP
jgi:MFS family permease